MSVAKESAMERLIQHIKDAMAIGKIADMDKTLNINSRNPVENKAITQAINGMNGRITNVEAQMSTFSSWVYGGAFDRSSTGADNPTITISADANPCTVILYATDEITGECALYIANWSSNQLNGVVNKIFDNYNQEYTPIVIDSYSSGSLVIGYDDESFISGVHHYSKVYYQILLPSEEE